MRTQPDIKDLRANYRSKTHFLRTIHADLEHRFLYMKNHKAGCTTILASLFQEIASERGEDYQPENSNAVHRSNRGYLERPSRMSDGDILGLFANDQIFKFTYMREPISRIVSAYADKIEPGQKPRERLLSTIGVEDDFHISLREFIHVLNESPEALDSDPHWRPQVKEISYGLIDYDYIGMLENLDEELPQILRQIFPNSNAEIFDARKKLRHRTKAKRMVKRLKEPELDILKKLYAEDIEAYQSLESKFPAMPRLTS